MPDDEKVDVQFSFGEHKLSKEEVASLVALVQFATIFIHDRRPSRYWVDRLADIGEERINSMLTKLHVLGHMAGACECASGPLGSNPWGGTYNV